ncbi:ornithine lipid N-methyltransferase [Tautonia sociabilis]|uniref:Methyltransferase domain-containing protein n=1 Tax=Tautonia sociabilis TaxID=2080755 RepID=A0A432MLA3_9BACT|nr:ornithine lipid N-methyltransferase [Tautonia sociabilis]RUL88204.1 methyltransferase domain-containing protein [Tautonia sociabilis]
MKESLLFLGKFLRHGTAIASLAPSSPWLSRATVRNVDWDNARVLIELGAGTGPITRELIRRARPETKLLVLERDPDFVRVLRDRFDPRPNLEIIEGDVRDLPAMLQDRGIERADAIISGLPVPSFPKDLQRDLFRNVGRVLEPGGSYNQITELPLVYLNFYRRFFDEVRFTFEPRNVPPAGAYYCRGVKPIP